TEDNFIDSTPVHSRITCHQGSQRRRGQVVAAQARQPPAIATERCSNCCRNENISHIRSGKPSAAANHRMPPSVQSPDARDAKRATFFSAPPLTSRCCNAC